jgi:hypothetical protein
MNGYILICVGNGKNDGKYVARDGSEHAYTSNLEHAKLFQTKESAEFHKCANETVHTLASRFGSFT